MTTRISAVIAFVTLAAVAAHADPTPTPPPATTSDQSAPKPPSALTPLPDLGTIVVGTKAYPPWIIKNTDGTWSGISIDAWKRVAAELDLKYVWKEIDLKDLAERGPEALGVDVVVSMTISWRTEKYFDMSHPFVIQGVGIATRAEAQSGVSRVLGKIASLRFVRNLVILLLIILAVGVVVWRIEHKTSPDEFGGTVARGIGGGVFWTVESLFAKPKPLSRRLHSRLVSLFWVIACMVLISGVTARLAAEFTVSQLSGTVSGAGDLPRVKVGAGATAKTKSGGARYCDNHGIHYTSYADPKALLEGLDRGEVDAIVDDTSTMRYLVATDYPDGRILILPDTLMPRGYGFGFKPGSPLRKHVNVVVMKLFEDGVFRQIMLQYLGSAPD